MGGPKVLLSQGSDFLILKELRPASERRVRQNEPNLSKKVKQILATLEHTLNDLIFWGVVGRSVGRRKHFFYRIFDKSTANGAKN